MRKALWSAAALLALLSGTGFIVGGAVRAAEPVPVDMVEGSQSTPSTWKFAPERIKVPVGTKVVWTNKGKIEHTATATGLFDSKTMPPGATFEFTFSTPGVVNYFCEPHEALGMTGVVEVTGGSTESPAPPTPGGTTATTAAGAAPTTTTTTAKAAAGGSTTTTTAGGGVTSTTQAPSVTPTSAPETGGVTTTTAAAGGSGEEAAGGGHGSEEPKSDEGNEKSSPLGIAFAAVSTLLLLGISGKLLASKS